MFRQNQSNIYHALKFKSYSMSYQSIRLSKHHKPIHASVCLNKQVDYDYYMAVLNYLYEQVELGFKPKYLVSLHYQHPVEHCQPVKLTNRIYGHRDRYGFKSKRSLWSEVAMYKFWERWRNDNTKVEVDAGKIRNFILKSVYSVKRLNRLDKYKAPNLFFFHEKGKVKLQYHTHILLPECEFSTEDLKDIFNTSLQQRCQCISRWKKVDIREVEGCASSIINYLNKETCSLHVALDFINSIPIQNSKP